MLAALDDIGVAVGGRFSNSESIPAICKSTRNLATSATKFLSVFASAATDRKCLTAVSNCRVAIARRVCSISCWASNFADERLDSLLLRGRRPWGRLLHVRRSGNGCRTRLFVRWQVNPRHRELCRDAGRPYQPCHYGDAPFAGAEMLFVAFQRDTPSSR